MHKKLVSLLALWSVAVLFFPEVGEAAGPRKTGDKLKQSTQSTCVDVFPDGKPQFAIEDKHFPTRLHAFIWRNWESVSLERMAKTVKTSQRNIRRMGLSMGLPKEVGPVAEFKTRGYVTIIRDSSRIIVGRD